MSKTNRELFICALQEADEYYLSQIPSESEIDITPSDRFEKRMSHLIQKTKHGFKQYTHMTLKKLTLVAAIIVILVSMAISVSAFREPIMDFIIETWENFTHLFTSETVETVPSEEKIKDVYSFDKLPAGFEQSYHNTDSLGSTTTWTNEVGEEIILSQSLKSADITLDTENSEMHEIEIFGQIAYTYTNKNITNIIWDLDDYIFLVSFPEHISIDEMKGYIKNHLVVKNIF